MAKSPWILYGATGKVGNIVLQRTSGKTVVRELVEKVKNPRSIDQQTQRMKISTLMGAYSTLKDICDHSFENIAYGAKSMQYFLKKNYQILNETENPLYNFRANKSLMPNRYLISQGSINVNVQENVDPAHNKTCFVTNIPAERMSTITVQEFHDELGIEVGDQLTFIVVGTTDEATKYVSFAGTQVQTSMVCARYIFDKNKAANKLRSMNYDDGESIDPANLSPKSILPQKFNVKIFPVTSADTICLTPSCLQFEERYAISFIVSHKENGIWKRSSSHLLPLIEITDNSRAIETYSPTNELYLNNAIT